MFLAAEGQNTLQATRCMAAQRRRRRCGSGTASPRKASEMTALTETSQVLHSVSDPQPTVW